jgi:hypothetical protein
MPTDRIELQTGDRDAERRLELRSFLKKCRSRLASTEVGLPGKRRRRAGGLRLDEVAELTGVSLTWYSSFESGRSVRVSPQFVSRVARALRLPPDEELRLFRLAFLEMYHL